MTTTEDKEPEEDLGSIFGDLAKVMADFKEQHGDINQAHAHSRENEPLIVNEVVVRGQPKRNDAKVGSFVAVRPCDAPSENKTFLGIYLGSSHRTNGEPLTEVGNYVHRHQNQPRYLGP